MKADVSQYQITYSYQHGNTDETRSRTKIVLATSAADAMGVVIETQALGSLELKSFSVSAHYGEDILVSQSAIRRMAE